jgi:spermidine/putrescine ABC transporter ATP-binding subunit
MATVELQGVVKRYGSTRVVDTVSLAVGDGEFVTLLGPSGCGKTTCLRMIAGFAKPDAGTVRIGGDDVTAVPPYRRETGMVFQQYALFPHLTVAQNVAFGLQVRRVTKQEVRQRVANALALVRLDSLAGRKPDQLSGGQKQRVALARALVVNPRVLLLDEPLGALDQTLREELQAEIKRIQYETGITAIFVTHDQAEALSLSDRIVVMRDGRIRQAGTPQQLYERPADRYVASCLGKINLLGVRVVDSDADGTLRVTPVHGHPQSWRVVRSEGVTRAIAGQRAWLGLRPEQLQLGDARPNRLTARVETATYAGDGWYLEVGVPGGERLIVKTPGRTAPATGDAVTLSWRPDDGVLLEDELSADVPEQELHEVSA